MWLSLCSGEENRKIEVWGKTESGFPFTVEKKKFDAPLPKGAGILGSTTLLTTKRNQSRRFDPSLDKLTKKQFYQERQLVPVGYISPSVNSRAPHDTRKSKFLNHWFSVLCRVRCVF